MSFIITESPTKAKKIRGYLGSFKKFSKDRTFKVQKNIKSIDLHL